MGFNQNKCKTQCQLCAGRIRLMRNKRTIQLKNSRREVANLLRTNKAENARIRVEAVMREETMLQAYDVVELFVELLQVRVAIVDRSKDLPPDMTEAVSSLIYAAARVTDLPELAAIKTLLASKFGKEYAAEAGSEHLCRKWHVNDNLIRWLSIEAPSPEDKMSCLAEIAAEHGVEWGAESAAAQVMPPTRAYLAGSRTSYSDPLTPPSGGWGGAPGGGGGPFDGSNGGGRGNNVSSIYHSAGPFGATPPPPGRRDASTGIDYDNDYNGEQGGGGGNPAGGSPGGRGPSGVGQNPSGYGGGFRRGSNQPPADQQDNASGGGGGPYSSGGGGGGPYSSRPQQQQQQQQGSGGGAAAGGPGGDLGGRANSAAASGGDSEDGVVSYPKAGSKADGVVGYPRAGGGGGGGFAEAAAYASQQKGVSFDEPPARQGGRPSGEQPSPATSPDPQRSASGDRWAPPPAVNKQGRESFQGHLDAVGKWKARRDSGSAGNSGGGGGLSPSPPPTVAQQPHAAGPSDQDDAWSRRQAAYDAAPGPPPKPAKPTGPPPKPTAPATPPAPPAAAAPKPEEPANDLDDLQSRFEALKRR